MSVLNAARSETDRATRSATQLCNSSTNFLLCLCNFGLLSVSTIFFCFLATALNSLVALSGIEIACFVHSLSYPKTNQCLYFISNECCDFNCVIRVIKYLYIIFFSGSFLYIHVYSQRRYFSCPE